MNRETGEVNAIVNPTGEDMFHCVKKIENALLIRDSYNLVFFDWATKSVLNIIYLDGSFGMRQYFMLVKRQGNDLVVLTQGKEPALMEIRLKLE